jgi:enoyl-CoA hydratase
MPPLTFTVDGRLGLLALSNPPRNVMNREFFDCLARTVHEHIAPAALDGLIVHSTGRHFSSGADIDELRGLVRAPGADTSFLTRNLDAFLALESLPFPVVAAISGACLGAGLELALACTARVAATNATLGLPESTFGLIPGCGGTVRLTRLVGRSVATRMILTGQSVDTQEALHMGLVDDSAPRPQLMERARMMVQRLASKAGTQ